MQNLTNITIPDSITKIGERAFAYCNSLTSITIPDGVTEISEYAFENCKKLTSVNPRKCNRNLRRCICFFENLTSIAIPDSVTEISESAFEWCKSLKNVTIPDSVIKIRDHAFDYCYGLTISVSDGSFAEQYAKDKCINYITTHIHTPDSFSSSKKSLLDRIIYEKWHNIYNNHFDTIASIAHYL